MANVLFIVEDPGAANLVVPLIPELNNRKIDFKIVAVGPSELYLSTRGVSHESGAGCTGRQIIERHGPSLIIVGTSENRDSVALEVVELSRNLGITTVGFIDQRCNAEYRFRGRSDASLTYRPDWLFVPDQATLSVFEALGFDGHRVRVSGSPHLDYIRQRILELNLEGPPKVRARVLPDASVYQKVIVFLAEANLGLQPGQCEVTEDYTLRGRGESRWRSCIILEEFLDALGSLCLTPDPYVVLRLHPKNETHDFVAYHSEVHLVSSGGTPIELMYAADAVVGMTSMALAEAVTMGRPTLSIIPRRSEIEWLPDFISGVISCVYQREQLPAALRSLLAAPTTAFERLYISGATDSMIEWIERFFSSGEE
jgi:hypothetical protein